LFPKFSLTGTLGLESESPGNWFDYASRYWSAGPTLQWNLFQSGSIRANIRVQNARQEQAWDAYQKTVLTALEDVENALTAYAKEQIRRAALARSAQADQQALDLSNELYTNGLTDFLQVLDSERSLCAAQDALVQSDQAIGLNLVQLYKALGGGWQNTPSSRPVTTTGSP
jgi:outer membrane protein TolC